MLSTRLCPLVLPHAEVRQSAVHRTHSGEWMSFASGATACLAAVRHSIPPRRRATAGILSRHARTTANNEDMSHKPRSVYFIVHKNFCDHLLFYEDGHFRHGSQFAFGGSDGHGFWQLEGEESLQLSWRSGPEKTVLRADENGAQSFSSPGVKLEFVAGENLRGKVENSKAARATSRGLVFSSVGNQCLPVVESWLQDPSAADFDVALVFYKEPDSPVLQKLKELAAEVAGMQVFQHEGMKWPNFRYWLELQGGAAEVAATYDYIWVVDDDVRLPTNGICRMFETLREHSQIAFASPSFDKESDGVWRFFDGHHPGCKLRYTNFVECTAPILKSSMLLDPRFQPCLRAVRTGCFIDFCFHPAAGGATDVVAVIDAVQCHHPPRTADYPSEMRQVQDWLEHKNDDILFEQEGVPRDWWAIEPRFFQPKVLGAIPAE